MLSYNLIMILFCLLGFIPLLAASPYSYRYPTNYGFGYPTNYGYGYPTNYGYGYSTNTFQMKLRNYGRSTDIIAQTRSLADSVKSTLRSLAADPDSAVIIDKIIRDKDNVCLNSLEEGLAGIETATQLVENAGDDIKR